MCTTLEGQTHFGQKRPQTERQSRCISVFVVVALKVARGSPEGRRSAPARVLRPLENMTKHGHAKNHVFYGAKRPSGQNKGSMFFQKRHTSRAKGPFYKPGRAGNGKRVWFGVLCEHPRAFAWVSKKPVQGRNGAGACTNSPSREPDEAQKALEAQRRNRKPLNIHHFFVMD